jgi:hypothetical protein
MIISKEVRNTHTTTLPWETGFFSLSIPHTHRDKRREKIKIIGKRNKKESGAMSFLVWRIVWNWKHTHTRRVESLLKRS